MTHPAPVSPDRWTQAVLKLTKLTRDGRIKWQRVPPADQKPGVSPPPFGGDEEAFVTQHEGQRLRLRRVSNIFAALFLIQSKGSQKAGAAQGYVLEIIDDQGRTVWTFPTVEALADLYQTVRYYQAGIGTFIDRLLEEP